MEEIIVEASYQGRIDDLLERMPRGSRVRIAKICKKENYPKFVQAVKNWIDRQEYDGGGVTFNQDYTVFKKSTEDPAKIFAPQKPQEEDSRRIDTKRATARAKLIKWLRSRLKDPVEPFYHKAGETVVDPKKTIEAGIAQLENADLDSRVFDAFYSRLREMADKIRLRDKAEAKANAPKKKGSSKKKDQDPGVYYYQILTGPSEGHYYSHLEPPKKHLANIRPGSRKEITLDEAKALSAKLQTND